MRKFFFNIGYAIFYLLSLLPFWFIYFLSDITAFCLAHIFRYRRRIVESNIRKAFPEFSNGEIRSTAIAFYSRFCDNFLEMIKLLSISERELNKRFTTDTSLLHHLHATSNKSITLVLAHVFNWEMANPAISLHNPFHQLVLYKKVGNYFFESLMMKLRERFHAKMISTQEFGIVFRNYQQKRYALVLVADQNQSNLKSAYWASFFGERVPFAKGPEKGAIINDNIVVYGKIYRKKRGYYYNTISLITETPRTTEKGFITKKIIALAEENIREDPANYLWSHRRFKHVHKYNDLFKRNLIE